MAKIQRAPELSFERYKKEFLPLVKPLFWILNKSFKNLTNALDGNLTYEDNFFSDERAVTGQTLAKIQSDGLTINTKITSPKNIIVDVIKADGTIITAAGIKWENLGGGNIKINDISILRETGSVSIQTNVSDAIILNSAHRNNTTGNPHNITAAKLGLIGIIKSATVTNSGRTLNLTLGNDTVLPFTPLSDDDKGKLDHITVANDVNLDTMASDIANRKVTDASVASGTLTINKTDGDITFEGGEGNVQSDWDETDTNEDDYIKNKPTTITSDQITLLNRFPTSVPPNGNVMIGDGSGSLIYRNLDAATIPIQSFHYLDYDHTTGMVIERYAEDTETVQIDPLIEYQPGFIQNEFELNDEGILSYIG